MKKIKSNFIKYKFIFKENTKHTSYLYQKVFRAIYGYHQNVTKNNNKIYTYFRKGLVSDIPYIKPGKNSVILPIGYETKLLEYFETGKNPTHNWKTRGDWKVEYTINEVDIDSESVIKSLEDYINNYTIINLENKNAKLLEEIDLVSKEQISNNNYINIIKNICVKIISNYWFKDIYIESPVLTSFYSSYQVIKQKL